MVSVCVNLVSLDRDVTVVKTTSMTSVYMAAGTRISRLPQIPKFDDHEEEAFKNTCKKACDQHFFPFP